MRSGDLARLAGVSVRTLRHYHQIGLLAEPPRSSNGYRQYTASDLVRVLRARRLVDLGVPLSRIDPSVDVEEELLLLDERYAAQIEELERRREAIRGLRQPGTRVDTPEFAQDYLRALSERPGVPPGSVDVERDAAVVLELFLGGGDGPGPGGLAGPAVADLVEVGEALLGLEDDAADDEVDAVARALASVFQRMRPGFADPGPGQEVGRAIEHHVGTQLSAAQREVVRRALRLSRP